MKLLLFGGTFDPPHEGHMSILKNAIDAVQPDKVLVMPAGYPPHKRASATPQALRLAMCACFAPLFPNLEISEMEMQRAGKSYTWDTVQELKSIYPGALLYVCIGSDMLLGFTQWHRWQELLREITLVVQNREHEDAVPSLAAAKMLEELGGRVIFAGGVVQKMSSTQIRDAIAAGRQTQDEIPPPADAIVCKYRLYQETI